METLSSLFETLACLLSSLLVLLDAELGEGERVAKDGGPPSVHCEGHPSPSHSWRECLVCVLAENGESARLLPRSGSDDFILACHSVTQWVRYLACCLDMCEAAAAENRGTLVPSTSASCFSNRGCIVKVSHVEDGWMGLADGVSPWEGPCRHAEVIDLATWHPWGTCI